MAPSHLRGKGKGIKEEEGNNKTVPEDLFSSKFYAFGADCYYTTPASVRVRCISPFDVPFNLKISVM